VAVSLVAIVAAYAMRWDRDFVVHTLLLTILPLGLLIARWQYEP
jgi:hypothetical protein